MKTGIKLLHKSSEGILKSFVQAFLYHNREVVYIPNIATYPNPSCGPLAVYGNTPEGLEAAMSYARPHIHDDSVAVYRCNYDPSEDTSLWFTFDGGERLDYQDPLCWYWTWKGKDFKPNWAIGEVIKTENLPNHTVLADMVMLTEEIPIK